MSGERPLVALTMGDVAGIGPEVIARAWSGPELHELARPFVIGSAAVLERACAAVGSSAAVRRVTSAAEAAESGPTNTSIPCLEPPTVSLAGLEPGRLDVRAGQAARDFLICAIDLALDGRIDAIVTLPLNKEALRAAGIPHPGHTEMLAERCKVADFSMMLYVGPPIAAGPAGVGVVHATLHVSLQQIFEMLTIGHIQETIALADRGMRPLTGDRPPRVAVAGLNPHAGEHGLFGHEEGRILTPAIALAQSEGVDVVGPIPADTIFRRALDGEFDAVVAMYHDQGHVALKTLAFDGAVNVTLGLPIIRTSVAHGTAFDIAGKGIARTTSLIEAVRVAARLWAGREHVCR